MVSRQKPWGDPSGVNWNAGLLRVAIVAGALWAAGALIWTSLSPGRNAVVWNGVSAFSTTIPFTIEERLIIAFGWPIVAVVSLWVLVGYVWPAGRMLSTAAIRWIGEGFNSRDDNHRS